MEKEFKSRPGEGFLIFFLLLFSIFVVATSWIMPHSEFSSSGSFPLIIGSVMIISVLHILWKNRKEFFANKLKEEILLTKLYLFPKDVAVYSLVLIAYIILLHPLHFWISSYLFMFVSFLTLRGAKPVKALIIGAGMLIGIWFLFAYIFKIVLW